MIELKDVNYKYKSGNVAIKNLNLKINDGEFVAIVGKNGSGKSTLGRLISGIEKTTTGSIIVNGLDTKNKKTALELRKNVGIIFQNPENQIIFNKVYDDIVFGMKNLGIDKKEMDSKVNNALKKVDMEKYINKDTYDLSLGQKQRIAIAGVLALDTKVIIFDEPTTMLDTSGKNEIYKIVKDLKQQGYTIVYITNVIDEILLADRIIVLKDGSIEKEFFKKDIMNNIDVLKELQIGLPLVIQFVEKLKQKNINIELNEFSIDELIKKM